MWSLCVTLSPATRQSAHIAPSSCALSETQKGGVHSSKHRACPIARGTNLRRPTPRPEKQEHHKRPLIVSSYGCTCPAGFMVFQVGCGVRVLSRGLKAWYRALACVPPVRHPVDPRASGSDGTRVTTRHEGSMGLPRERETLSHCDDGNEES